MSNKNHFVKDVAIDQYKKLFELSQDPIFVVDSETRKIIDANLSAVKFYGYPLEELLQMGFNELSADKDDRLELSDKSSDRISNCLQKRKDGKLFRVDVTLIDITNEQSNLKFLVIKDLSKIKAIENKLLEDELSFIYYFEKNSRPMLIYEAKSLKLLSANDSAVAKYGYSKEEFQHFSLLDLIPEDDRKTFFEIVKRADTQTSFIYETKHKLKDNTTICVEVNSQQLKYNGSNAQLIEIIDITAQKMYEKELIFAKEKAQEISRMKNIFFTNMSHELRTPLSGILGFSELLLEEIKDKEHRNMINAISINGQRLLDTLNKILHLSKFESEKLNIKLEEINIAEFINKLLPKFEKNLVSKNLFLKFTPKDLNLILNADKEFLETILENIISNAIKFTNSGGVLVNCFKNSNEEPQTVIIEISDTGIGISPSSTKLIFEEFRQASEGLSRNYDGMGLGLTIAKKYTELLGGKISVESTPGAGSTFRLEFPASLSKGLTTVYQFNDKAETEKKGNNSSEKPLVLLVEDDFMNTNMIKKFLQEICILHTVTNGEDALKEVKQNKFDAILMDIGLGKGINGIDTTKLIRLMPDYKNIPIIAVTAYAMNGDKEKFLSSGMTGYISKPFVMNDLVNVLGKALKLV